MSKMNDASRREFLKATATFSALGAAAPFALNLASIGSAAAQAAGDYRALVCLFWFGGNDQTNTLIPYDLGPHTEYFDARSSIAIGPAAGLPAGSAAESRAALTATRIGAVASQGGREFALHPALTEVRNLYAQGKAAIIANVGPLVAPITKAQYEGRSVPVPPKLFSHNDQQSVWQANVPQGEGAAVGWGGRIGDLLVSRNTQPIFTAMSASGNALWLSGNEVRQYQVSSSGAVQINNVRTVHPYSGDLAAGTSTYERMLTRTVAGGHLFANEIGAINRRSIDANGLLANSLPAASMLTPAVPSANGLANQLNIVARTIAARSSLQTNRQVFFVSLGGFDNHDFLLTQQALRLQTVNEAIGSFWAWLGNLGMQNNVTLFTASDFGRTVSSNGDGSDHGWGAHHFAIGGAVQGGTIYGEVPDTVLDNSQDIGSGNLIPTIAVDQYAATLARWIGVPESDMASVLPNVGAYPTRYLNFLGT
jgi:uncharacterized protein (DUF1501 family)